LKKYIRLLNTMIGSAIGVFIGHVAFHYFHYKTYPGFYQMQSAPWYTSSIIYGAVTIAIILILTIIKLFLIRNSEK
jgi:uncharacterized membrane protein YgaE (UPF0421/DUF939 family)